MQYQTKMEEVNGRASSVTTKGDGSSHHQSGQNNLIRQNGRGFVKVKKEVEDDEDGLMNFKMEDCW